VNLDSQELQAVRGVMHDFEGTDEQLVRAAFMLWYQRNRAKPHWVRPDGIGCSCLMKGSDGQRDSSFRAGPV
jgi:hypothetical protein